AQVAEDQVALGLLCGRERLVISLEAREPFLAEGLARCEARGAQIAEAMVVHVNARDRRGDGLELEPVVDELPDELDERGVYRRTAEVRVLVRLLGVCCGRRRRGRRGLVARCLVTEGANALADLSEDIRELPRAE